MIARRVALTVLAALAVVQPVSASSVSPAQLRELARAARTDPDALRRLRAVDRVGGRPVDVGAALAGASGSDLDRRLGVLAADAGTPAAQPGRARGDAQSILRQRRFHRHHAPRPFRGVLAFVGDHVVRPLGRALGAILPSSLTVWAILGAAVLLLAVALARRAVSRRVELVTLDGDRLRPKRTDPRRLEREADEAERRGELERAIRLRFRAGLLRLEDARAIELEEPVTTGEVRRRLRLREFEDVARSFDEVVYGRRPPGERDVELSRAGWRAVLATAGAR